MNNDNNQQSGLIAVVFFFICVVAVIVFLILDSQSANTLSERGYNGSSKIHIADFLDYERIWWKPANNAAISPTPIISSTSAILGLPTEALSPSPVMTPISTPTSPLTPSPTLSPAPDLLRAGDAYYFGTYEQDNNASNGPEKIEWIVLTTDNDGVLLISRYVLDCQPYNEVLNNAIWESCSLRAWMNEVFYQNAFKSDEQDGILSKLLDNGNYASTTDRVFALSFTEADKYLTADILNTRGTVYARAQGAKFLASADEKYDRKVYWWLRTPGEDPEHPNYAMTTYVSKNTIDKVGNPVGPYFYKKNGEIDRKKNVGVRPSLWLSWEYIYKHSASN